MCRAKQASSGGFLTVQAFTLIALGGLGNYPGALLAALLLGLAEVGTSYFFGSNAAAGAIYLIFIAVLIFRPWEGPPEQPQRVRTAGFG